MDVIAGRIGTGEATIADIGRELFHPMLEVASGMYVARHILVDSFLLKINHLRSAATDGTPGRDT